MSTACTAATFEGSGCRGTITDGQCSEQDDHHPTPGMLPYDGPGAESADTGQARALDDDAKLAEALIADGFDPPPYVGEVFIDESTPSAPGARSTTTAITALGKTVTGWQARVTRREFDAAGHVVHTGRGLLYVHHLLSGKYPFRYRRAADQVPDTGQTGEAGTPVFGTGPGDPFRLQKWAALADDVCMFAGCNASETDQRGPVWLRGDGMAKACTEHWEPIMRVIGEQATWERTDGARLAGIDTTTPVVKR